MFTRKRSANTDGSGRASYVRGKGTKFVTNSEHLNAGFFTNAPLESVEEGGVLKNALVLVEGTHKSMEGKYHQVTPANVMQIVKNTNDDWMNGVDIPFLVDHQKNVLNRNGDSNSLGRVASELECRIVQQEDLPDPRLRHLIGKIGAFTKIHVTRKVEDVQNKSIKDLSPGINFKENKIFEISAVNFPSITGLSLFSSIDYDEIKKQRETSSYVTRQLEECTDIFYAAIEGIEESGDRFQGDESTKKSFIERALQGYMRDLREKLELEPLGEQEESDGQSESPNWVNPYQPNLMGANPNNKTFSKKIGKKRNKIRRKVRIKSKAR
jgi:hypothetical protein